jgi:hypothetical protein
MLGSTTQGGELPLLYATTLRDCFATLLTQTHSARYVVLASQDAMGRSQNVNFAQNWGQTASIASQASSLTLATS